VIGQNMHIDSCLMVPEGKGIMYTIDLVALDNF